MLLWLVTEDPSNSGVVQGQASAGEHGQDFWDGQVYRPLAWCSHWMPTPEGPGENKRPAVAGAPEEEERHPMPERKMLVVNCGGKGYCLEYSGSVELAANEEGMLTFGPAGSASLYWHAELPCVVMPAFDVPWETK